MRDFHRLPPEGFMTVEVGVRLDLELMANTLSAEQIAAVMAGVAEVIAASKAEAPCRTP